MSNSSEDKRTVLIGLLLAWISSLAFIGIGYWLARSQNWFDQFSVQEIISMTLLPPSFSLVAGIGWAAKTRHLKQNIDGSTPEEGSPLDVTLRYVRNTTEQLLLFLLMVFCLLGALPIFAQKILPVLGLWFLIARIMFWVGYSRNPTSRAIGFASTFHPIIVFLVIGSIGLLAKF